MRRGCRGEKNKQKKKDKKSREILGTKVEEGICEEEGEDGAKLEIVKEIA